MLITKGKKTLIDLNNIDNTIVHKSEFIIDVLDHDELSSYTLENNDKKFNFADLYQLDIKINAIGKSTFFFVKENFNKDEVINKISILRNMETTNNELKIKKINSLFEIVKPYNPLLIVYSNGENSDIKREDIIISDINVIFIDKNHKKLNKKETPISKYFFELGKNKITLIFSGLALLLSSFSVLIGVYDTYINNAAYIFFFIILVVGLGLNGFIFYDLYKKVPFKKATFITTIIFDLIVTAGGTGLFILYRNSLKDVPLTVPGLDINIITGLGVLIGLFIISIIAPLLIKKLINKKK